MSIKQTNVPSVIFFFLYSAHSRGGGGGGGVVVHGTNFVGGGAVSGGCRGRSRVGPMATPETSGALTHEEDGKKRNKTKIRQKKRKTE